MPAVLLKLLKVLPILLIPIILIFGFVHLLTTDSYLTYEYGKSSFPADSYGFTPQQRFIMASTNIHYVRAHLPSDELSRQTLNGAHVYNEREISHMVDVRAVFHLVLRVWQVAFVLFTLIGTVLWRNGCRMAFFSAVQWGGVLTAGLILTSAVFALFAWQIWFELLHRLFFIPGSWLFSYQDALILLFPMQFWLDATLAISFLSFISGTLLALLGWLGQIGTDRQHIETPQPA
jgi:integral membrane protein (TIGR01906 family)